MSTTNVNDQTLLANHSMATSFTSAWVPLIANVSFSMQAVWTGSPTGTMILQSSCDTASNEINILPVNPDTIIGSSYSVAGAAGSNTWAYNLGVVPFNWVRFSYTAASGTGNLTSLTFNGK